MYTWFPVNKGILEKQESNVLIARKLELGIKFYLHNTPFPLPVSKTKKNVILTCTMPGDRWKQWMYLLTMLRAITNILTGYYGSTVFYLLYSWKKLDDFSIIKKNQLACGQLLECDALTMIWACDFAGTKFSLWPHWYWNMGHSVTLALRDLTMTC